MSETTPGTPTTPGAPPPSETPDYLLGHIEEALARDPRVNELGLVISLRGSSVYVSGTVSTEQRRAAVQTVVAETAPGYRVHNETSVATLPEPEGMEPLS